MEDNFSRDRGGGDGFQITFSVHFISIITIITSAPTSDHQVLDLRGLGPLLYLAHYQTSLQVRLKRKRQRKVT